jgi:GT2 family glycosyltransferase
MGAQRIQAIPPSRNSPFWSVMIPTYNPRKDYLEKAIGSLLEQDQGPERMHIEVVDDCSTKVDVASMVKDIAGERVGYFQNPTNLGLAGCWNACIARARGVWVHILHQDDYILPGFYQRLEKAAQSRPEVGLIASRSLFVDEQGIIQNVTPRLRNLEHGGHAVDDFFYTSPYANPIQCPGVVVRREVYAILGGFRSDLKYTLDCEMWARVIGICGGVVVPDVMASYRNSSGNESSNLWRTAEALRDFTRLNGIFAERYPDFDADHAKSDLCDRALISANEFSKMGDKKAAQANLRYWRQNAPVKRQLIRFMSNTVRKLIG